MREFLDPSRPAARPVHSPAKCVSGLCPEGKGPRLALTIHPYLVPRSRKEQSYACDTLLGRHGLLQRATYLSFFTSSHYISYATFDKIFLLNQHSFVVHNIYGTPQGCHLTPGSLYGNGVRPLYLTGRCNTTQHNNTTQHSPYNRDSKHKLFSSSSLFAAHN